MKITKLYIFLIAGLIIFLSSTAYLVKDSQSLNKNSGTKVFSDVKNEAQKVPKPKGPCAYRIGFLIPYAHGPFFLS